MAYPSELRHSALSGRWVLIAAGRAKRPDDWPAPPKPKVRRDPFKPANIPKADITGSIPDERGDWKVVSIKNKFPFLAPGPRPDLRGHVRDGYGFHEIVIHSRDPKLNFEDFTPQHTAAVLELFWQRYQSLAKEPRIKHVQIFTNRGHEAGASVAHPHSQIVALPIVPPYVQRLMDVSQAYFKQHGESVVEDEISRETREATRVIEETEHFMAYCPFAPRANFHVRVLPKRGRTRFQTISVRERADLAIMINRTYRRLDAVSNIPPYNSYLHTPPVSMRDDPGFRWHMDVVPHLSTPGGLELSTGLDVLTVAPEEAARQLRAVKL